VLALHEELDGEIKMLTKGDNNSVFDRVMYAPGQMWLKRSDIIGKAKGVLPLVGMATIYLNDYPYFKYALVSTMGFFVLTNKE
jgi:signal peptidase